MKEAKELTMEKSKHSKQRGRNQCKSPTAVSCLECGRSSKKASVAEVSEGERSRK